MLALIIWGRWCLSGFPAVKISLSPLCSYVFWERFFEAIEVISCFFLNICSLILAFISGSCWQQLLLCCSNGDSPFPSFLLHLLSGILLNILSFFSYQYEFMHIHFILWFIIQYYWFFGGTLLLHRLF